MGRELSRASGLAFRWDLGHRGEEPGNALWEAGEAALQALGLRSGSAVSEALSPAHLRLLKPFAKCYL